MFCGTAADPKLQLLLPHAGFSLTGPQCSTSIFKSFSINLIICIYHLIIVLIMKRQIAVGHVTGLLRETFDSYFLLRPDGFQHLSNR